MVCDQRTDFVGIEYMINILHCLSGDSWMELAVKPNLLFHAIKVSQSL